jgi:acetaldehyde dehydrogenase (acetylating)
VEKFLSLEGWLMDNMKVQAAIIGPGNIGIDLMYKILRRSRFLDLKLVSGIISKSEGLKIAKKEGIAISAYGIDAVLKQKDVKIVFDATGAAPHIKHAPLLKKAGKIAVDLTPAAIGPYVIPVVNLSEHLNAPNINLITCGGQATIPIVKAISRVCSVPYAEIVSTIASKSAGPGTRQNIDEFTQTTAKGIVEIGGAIKGKAIILLNPALPPMTMNCIIYAKVTGKDEASITCSVSDMVSAVQQYVPGYRLKIPPTFDGDNVTIMIEVEGAGDYLNKYSGNLDIMTCAALAVGDGLARHLLGQKPN